MAESRSARQRREEEARRRARRRALSPDTYLRMGRRALRRRLRQLTAAQRRRIRREIRKRQYKAKKRLFGPCPTCGRANSPGHTCSMRFSERNSDRLRRRMERREQADHPNLRQGRRAA